MRRVFVPFALELYRRHRNGETIEQLAVELEIPLDRVEQRIRAAEVFWERRIRAGLPDLSASLTALDLEIGESAAR